MFYSRLKPIPIVFLLLLLPINKVICQTNHQPKRINYHFNNHGYTSLADSLIAKVDTRFVSLLSTQFTFSVEIYLTNSEKEFDSLAGGKLPDWGAAVAIPIWNRIVIKSPDHFRLQKTFSELLLHEYAHLALTNRIGMREVPRWFNEGFAIMTSSEWDWAGSVTMNIAAIFGNTISLGDIDKVNLFNTSKARIAYAESYLAVQYLYEMYGKVGVNILLDSIAAGAALDNSLIAATGSNYANFEQEFRVYLNQKFNLVSLMADTMYFWLALAVLLIIGGWLSYRRRNDYYEKWEEEDQLASTDFDYGDPDNPEQTDDEEPWVD